MYIQIHAYLLVFMVGYIYLYTQTPAEILATIEAFRYIILHRGINVD
jgi:hypothetical protein